jgi:hypothetical protein
MMRRGLLLTMTEPPAAMEEEFNAWYDTEHLPERLAIPGFRSARRWVATGAPGEGKYLATYELDSSAVLQSPQYLARYAGATPWTRRCLGRCVLFKRWACEQLQPGDGDLHPLAKALLLLTGEREIDVPSIAGALQVRRFVASAGEPRHIALIELGSATPRLPAAEAGKSMRLYRDYAA